MTPTYPSLISRRLVATILALAVVVALVPATASAAERWLRIGKAAHSGSETMVDVGGRGPFDALRLRVTSGELALESLLVTFTDGSEMTIDRALRIPSGANSPKLDLGDEEKEVQSIAIRGTGDAKLTIEGLLD